MFQGGVAGGVNTYYIAGFVCLFQGVYVTYVYEGGPAHQSGLQVHDKLLQVSLLTSADLTSVRGRSPWLPFSKLLYPVRALDRAGVSSDRSALAPSTSRSLPSHLHRCYFLCDILVVSSHHMAIPRKALLSEADLFVSDSVFPCHALNPSWRFRLRGKFSQHIQQVFI